MNWDKPVCQYLGHIDRKQADEMVEAAQVDIINWAMQLCGSGMTTGMIRKLLHNKIVEITGEGEKA